MTLCHVIHSSKKTKESVYSHSASFHNESGCEWCSLALALEFLAILFFCRRLKDGMDMSGPCSNATKFFQSRIIKQLTLEDGKSLEKNPPSDKEAPQLTSIAGSEAISIGPVRHKAARQNKEIHSCIASERHQVIQVIKVIQVINSVVYSVYSPHGFTSFHVASHRFTSHFSVAHTSYALITGYFVECLGPTMHHRIISRLGSSWTCVIFRASSAGFCVSTNKARSSYDARSCQKKGYWSEPKPTNPYKSNQSISKCIK